MVVEVREKLIDFWVDAGWFLTDDLLGVEVRDTLTTHISSKNILMSVDKRVYASVT